MKVIRTVATVLLSFQAVIILTLLFVTVIASSLIYPSFYEDALHDAGIYNAIEAQVTGVSNVNDVIIPRATTQAIVNDIIDDILSYIRSESEELSIEITIDQTIIRNTLINELEKLPVCSDSETSDEQQHITCLPQDKTPQSYADEIMTKNDFLNNPQTLDLTEQGLFREGSPEKDAIDEVRRAITLLKISIIAYIFLFFVLLVLIYIVMPFAKKDIVLDAGIIITISAVFLLFIGFFLHIITAQAIGINEPMIEAITSFVLAKLFERCMIFGALLLIIGITIIITGVVIMKKKSVKEAKELEKK